MTKRLPTVGTVILVLATIIAATLAAGWVAVVFFDAL
jgi:hypothetical protein